MTAVLMSVLVYDVVHKQSHATCDEGERDETMRALWSANFYLPISACNSSTCDSRLWTRLSVPFSWASLCSRISTWQQPRVSIRTHCRTCSKSVQAKHENGKPLRSYLCLADNDWYKVPCLLCLAGTACRAFVTYIVPGRLVELSSQLKELYF